MGLDIRPGLAHWLVDQGVLPKRVLNASKNSGKGMVSVEPKLSALFENGIKMFQLMESLSQVLGVPMDVNVSALQHQHSPVAKLYNWNVLSQTLSSFNIPLDADMKALIVAGDTEVIVDVLEQLLQLEKGSNKSNGSHGNSDTYQGISRHKQASMNGHGRANGHANGHVAERSLNKAESERRESSLSNARSWVEFLGAVFAFRLQIGEKQALGLVQGSSEYFQRLCKHGMNGNVTAVSRSFQDMFNGGKKFAALLAKEPRSVTQALSLLKYGLTSSSADVAVWTARLLAKIGQEFRTSNIYGTVWEWFVMEDEGLDSCVESHRIHGGLKGGIFQVLDSFSYGHLHDLLVEDMRRNISNPMEYMVFLPSLFPHLAANRVCKDAMVAMGTVDNIVDFALKFADSNAPNNTRLAAVEVLAESWIHFPDLVELRTDTTRQILGLMKKNCRDSNIQLQIASITCLYTLLDFFTEQRNAFAPVVYKTLIFSLIENHGDEFLRNYIMTNMIITLEKTPNIPVGVMLDPLLKQVAMHGYHNLDFDFFLTLSKHPKLDLRYSLQFLELLGRIVLTDTLHSRLATVPFLIILNRFGMANEVVEHAETFTKRALAAFMESAPAAVGVVPSQRTANDLDTDVALTSTILEAIAKIGHLGNSSINSRVHALLLDAVREFAETYGQDHDGLRSIVRYFGDDSAINNDLTMFTKRPPSQRGFAMNVRQPEGGEPTSSRSSVATEHLEEPKQDSPRGPRGPSPERIKARQLAAKRQRDIEKVKQRRLARLEKQRQEEERRRLRSARIKRRLKEYREKQVQELKARQAEEDDDDIEEDPDLLAKLNAELLVNPEMEMPKGYVKVKVAEDTIHTHRSRRRSIGDDSEAIATWALDAILWDALEVRIVDPAEHGIEQDSDNEGNEKNGSDSENESENENEPKRIYEARYDHAGAKAREARRSNRRGMRASGSETESPEPGGRASRGPPRPPEAFDDKKHFASRATDLALKYPDAKERATAVFMLEILDGVVGHVLGDMDDEGHNRQRREIKASRGLEHLNEKKKKEEMEFKMKEIEREKKRKKRMEESKAKLAEYQAKKEEMEEQRKEEEMKLKFASEAAKEKERQKREQRKKEQAARLEEWKKKKEEEDAEKAKIEAEQKKKIAEEKKKLAEDYEARAKEREEREKKKQEAREAKKKAEEETRRRSMIKQGTMKPLKKSGTQKSVAAPGPASGRASIGGGKSGATTQRSSKTETFVAPGGVEEEMDVYE